MCCHHYSDPRITFNNAVFEFSLSFSPRPPSFSLSAAAFLLLFASILREEGALVYLLEMLDVPVTATQLAAIACMRRMMEGNEENKAEMYRLEGDSRLIALSSEVQGITTVSLCVYKIRIV